MTRPLVTLEDAWRMDTAFADQRIADEILSNLLDRHAEPHRRYHGRAHLRALVELMNIYAPHISAGAPPRLAIWWHDAIYDPQARDNEEQSAAQAQADLVSLGAAPAIIDETARIILATKNHFAEGSHGDGDYFLDADISILGAPPAKYVEYAQQVREEYAWAPDDLYRAGRAAFLNKALALPRLFRTNIFETTYAAQARENMAQELAALT